MKTTRACFHELPCLTCWWVVSSPMDDRPSASRGKGNDCSTRRRCYTGEGKRTSKATYSKGGTIRPALKADFNSIQRCRMAGSACEFIFHTDTSRTCKVIGIRTISGRLLRKNKHIEIVQILFLSSPNLSKHEHSTSTSKKSQTPRVFASGMRKRTPFPLLHYFQ